MGGVALTLIVDLVRMITQGDGAVSGNDTTCGKDESARAGRSGSTVAVASVCH